MPAFRPYRIGGMIQIKGKHRVRWNEGDVHRMFRQIEGGGFDA
jgi:hypothetical protein